MLDHVGWFLSDLASLSQEEVQQQAESSEMVGPGALHCRRPGTATEEFDWGPMQGGAKATSLGECFRAMLLATLAAQCLLSGLADRHAGTGVDRAGSGFSKI